MHFVRVSLVLISLAMIGCGGGPAPVSVQPQAKAAPTQIAKSVLETVAGTGEVGSGVGELRTALEELKQTDSAKATALLTDLDALEKSANPEAAKAKAKAMLGKL